MCQIAWMQRAIVKAFGAFMALAMVSIGASMGASTGALAQRNGSDWDLPGRPVDQQPVGQQPGGKGAAGTSASRNNTLEALDKILSSSKLSALDRSLYLGIRAYQLSRLGREADSRMDIDERGRVLPAGWE